MKDKKDLIFKILIIIPAIVALIFCIIALVFNNNDLFFGIALILLGVFYSLYQITKIQEHKKNPENKLTYSFLIFGIIFIIAGIVIVILRR